MPKATTNAAPAKRNGKKNTKNVDELEQHSDNDKQLINIIPEEPQNKVMVGGKKSQPAKQNTKVVKTTKTKQVTSTKVETEPKSKQPNKSMSKKSKKDEDVAESDEDNDADDDVEETGDGAVDSTQDNSESKFEKLIISLEETRKKISTLQKEEKLIIKKLNNVHKSELKKASNRKRRANAKPTGFATKKEIRGKLADWLKVENGTMMTGPEISSNFWKRIREEGLQYEDNKRIFRANKEVADIFGVDMKLANKSTDPKDANGFNMRTYQTHIAHALANNNN